MENVFGVDVAKNWIDVVGPNGHARVGNNDLDDFARRVARCDGRVAFEASGGYEEPLRCALAKAGVPEERITVESYFNHKAEPSQEAIETIAKVIQDAALNPVVAN